MADDLNEKVKEYVDRIKNNLLDFANALDVWFERYNDLREFLGIGMNMEAVRSMVDALRDKINKVYAFILSVEENIDYAIANSLFGKIAEFEDLLNALIEQSSVVKDSGKNVAEGFLPTGIELEVPTTWKKQREFLHI